MAVSSNRYDSGGNMNRFASHIKNGKITVERGESQDRNAFGNNISSEAVASLNSGEEASHRLAQAIRKIKQDEDNLNSSINANDSENAIRIVVKMLDDLRRPWSPQHYFELWMQVYGELCSLHSFLISLKEKKKISLAHLYRSVQHTQHIVPRLYLMITVGSAMTHVKECSSQAVLQDLIEMTKGIQNPTRGLFARNYLLKMTQDLLSENYDCALDYATRFVMQNFEEMTRLWIRMQRQISHKSRAQRENDRLVLKVLIGYNLVRLGEFEDMELSVYESLILDKILDMVTNSKDFIAQQYILDVTIQVFPRNFHLNTLPKLLDAISHLEESVSLGPLLVSLMERIIKSDNPSGEQDEDSIIDDAGVSADVFEQLYETISTVYDQDKAPDAKEVLSVLESLIEFSAYCYKGQLSYIDRVVRLCSIYVDLVNPDENSLGIVDRCLTKLMRTCIKHTKAMDLLDLNCFVDIMSRLYAKSRRKVSHSFLVHALSDTSLSLNNTTIATKLLEFISPLLAAEIETSEDVGDDEEEEHPPSTLKVSRTFVEQQQSVAKLIHKFHSDDPVVLFEILKVVHKFVCKTDANRAQYTFVPLCFRLLALSDIFPKTSDNEAVVKLRKVFQYLFEMISSVAEIPSLRQTGLKLFLHAARCADNTDNHEVAYELLVQAFLMYEDVVATKDQLHLLPLMIGTLQEINILDEEEDDRFITKLMQYARRFLKKTDQGKMLLLCSHLHWRGSSLDEGPAATSLHDGGRILESLKRAKKTASGSQGANVKKILSVAILNRYLYFLKLGVPEISVTDVSKFISEVKTEFDDENATNESAAAFFRNTIAHVDSMVKENPEYAMLLTNVAQS